jgi:hypothetical protein
MTSSSRRVLLGALASALLVPLWAQDCSLREIGADDSKTATLAAGDCRLRNLFSGSTANNYAHPYGVTLPRDGILTIDLKSTAVDAYLYVFSLGGTRLAANDNLSAQTTDSRIVISLRRGTYVLLATTRGVATGAYTLQTSLGTPSACTEQDALLDSPLDGELRLEGCRYRDVVAPTTDTSGVVLYRLAVPSRAVLTVKMTGKGFSPYLDLLDSRYDILASADAGGDPETELVMSLAPGSYVLLASSSASGATGSFTLSMTLAEPRSCPAAELGPGQSVKSQLSYSEDCRYLDIQTPSWDTTPVKLYRVVTDKRGVLALSLSSTQFTPYLAIADQNGVEINSTASDEEPGPTAQIITSLPPGTYFVLANTWDLDGEFTLLSDYSEPRACTIDDIQPGQPAQGALAAGGCRILDLLSPNGIPAPAAGYRLTLQAPGVLTAEQTSTQLDTWLLLYDASARILAADDDGGGGTNSRLKTLLAPGAYLLAASTADGSLGAFTLSAQLADAPACAITPLEPTATVSDQWATTDCRIHEAVAGAVGDVYVKSYRVVLPEAGRLRLELASRTTATLLVLADAESRPIQTVSIGLDGVARLAGKRLEAGTYTVHAAATGTGRTDSFSLQAGFEAGP